MFSSLKTIIIFYSGDVNFNFRLPYSTLTFSHHLQTCSELPFICCASAPLPSQCILLIPANHVMVSAQRAPPPNPLTGNINVLLSVTRELWGVLFKLSRNPEYVRNRLSDVESPESLKATDL